MSPATSLSLHRRLGPTRALYVLCAGCVTLLLAACGSSAPGSQETQGAPGTTPSAPTATPIAPYGVHEWGFIAASVDGDTVSAVSGPRGLSSPPVAHGPDIGAARVDAEGKPVLYFHLDEGVSELALSVGVRPAGRAQLLEHFPPGELSADQRVLRWPSVRITRGACRGQYPALADPRCQTSDGLCELAELPGYESAGADCVNVGEQRTGLLFYRTGPAQATLPLTVSRHPEEVVYVSHAPSTSAAAASGWVMRVFRGEQRSETRVRVHRLADEESLRVPPANGSGGSSAQTGVEHLRAAIVASGLDEPEAAAFMAAWTDTLFGAESPAAAPSAQHNTFDVGSASSPAAATPHPLGSVHDAIIYLLPQASVDALLPIELTPAPRSIQRVFLARVTLLVRPLALTLEEPVVHGGLSRDMFQRVMQRYSSVIRQCLLDSGGDNAPSGLIQLEVHVLPAGTVERMTPAGVDIGDQARACVSAQGQRITFPATHAATRATQPITISH